MGRRRFASALAIILCAGCAGVSPMQVGQTAGTIAGAAVIPGIGAPIGALVGLLAGMLLQNEVDKVTEQKERKELGDQLRHGSAAASASASPSPEGQPTRVWVDETVQQGRLIAGHFEVRNLQ